jgi:hypothetical protein
MDGGGSKFNHSLLSIQEFIHSNQSPAEYNDRI